MGRLAVVLALSSCAFAQSSSSWQREMEAGIASLARPETLRDAEGHFRAAVDLASTPAEKAAALTRVGMVLQSQRGSDKDYLTSVVEPLYTEALGLFGETRSPDRALTLELNAVLLDQIGLAADAARNRAQAAEIRKSLFPGITNQSAVKIGDGVAPPQLANKIEPQYTNEARLMKYQGTVALQVVVGKDGSIHDAALLRSLGFGLDEQALAAVRQWKFQPAMASGIPVDVKATIEVRFRLL